MYRICLIIISVEKLVIIKFAYNCFTMVIQYVISVLVRRLMLIIQTIKFATLRRIFCGQLLCVRKAASAVQKFRYVMNVLHPR